MHYLLSFSWDESKAEENEAKHGVSFQEASTVFSDPMVMFEENAGSTEPRFTAIGISSLARTLYVVFVELKGDVTRIISARKATRHERKRYEEEG